MKKMDFLRLILRLVFPIGFNILFFVIGGYEHDVSVWLGYGFIHFAYLALILTRYMIVEGKSRAVYGFSLYYISAFYFIIQLITGLVFIIVAPEKFETALWLQLIFAGLYLIIFIANMMANEKTSEAEEKRQPQIDYIKNSSRKLKSLLDGIKDKDTYRKVERAYDALYSSPVKTHPSLEQLEQSILQQIDTIEDSIESGNKERIITEVNKLQNMITDRNSKLKTLSK